MKREFLYLSGFLKDGSEDDSLKFEFKIPHEIQSAIFPIMGWASLEDSYGGGWLLSAEQVSKISAVIGQPLPIALGLYIETLVES